jgi:predicted nucleotidyltransferase
MVKTKDELEKNLRDFIESLIEKYSIEAVVLFGSYSGGIPSEYSDIDVAVFSPDFGVNPLAEMTELCKIRRSIDTDIEPLPFSAKEFYEYTKADFVSEIIEKGKIIYKNGKILI